MKMRVTIEVDGMRTNVIEFDGNNVSRFNYFTDILSHMFEYVGLEMWRNMFSKRGGTWFDIYTDSTVSSYLSENENDHQPIGA